MPISLAKVGAIGNSEKSMSVGEAKQIEKDRVLKAAQGVRWSGMGNAARRELQQQMLDCNICFECKKISETFLTACACFNTELCNGTTLCESCVEDKTRDEHFVFCHYCITYLCSKSCNSAQIMQCVGCSNCMCKACAENNNECGSFCQCGNWFCKDCKPSHSECKMN